MKNFEGSICITFGYIVSPVNTTKADIPIMEYVQDNWKKFYNAHIKGKDLNIN